VELRGFGPKKVVTFLLHVEWGDGVLLCGAAVFKLVPFSFFGVSVLVPDTFQVVATNVYLIVGIFDRTKNI